MKELGWMKNWKMDGVKRGVTPFSGGATVSFPPASFVNNSSLPAHFLTRQFGELLVRQHPCELTQALCKILFCNIIDVVY